MIDLDKLRKSEGYMLAIVNTKTGKYEPVSEDIMLVRHGKWISKKIMVHNYYAITGFKCSVCGEDALTDCGHLITIKTNFCPNCGARMDEDER